jgi:hypothetical protein
MYFSLFFLYVCWWRLQSSGIWFNVVCNERTNITDEPGASCFPHCTLKMKETGVYPTTWCHIPQDCNFYIHGSEKLKSSICFLRAYCNLFLSTEDAVQILSRLYNNLQVVTTINYNTLAGLHNFRTLHTYLFMLSSVVFTYLQQNMGTIQVSLNYNTISVITNHWFSLTIFF